MAALVRHVGKDTLTLLLYNANDAKTDLLLVAGTYGQHQWTGATVDDGKEQPQKLRLDGRKVRLTLRPKSLVRLTLGIARYLNEPTLQPQLDDQTDADAKENTP